MWPYLAFGSLFAAAATLGRPARPPLPVWIAFFALAVLFVGLRHHVGMDWNNYLRMIHAVESSRSWGEMLSQSEPLYALLLGFGAWTGGGIYVVNLIATCAVMAGVFALARRCPEPWLALVAAMPMFMLVVAMSANRQALAAGLLMLLVANWYRFGIAGRVIFIIFCAGFHASSALMLAFVAIDLKIPQAFKIVGIAIFSAAAVVYLQQVGWADYYNQAYGTGQTEMTQSSGAVIHVAMNAVPAAFYFLFPRHRKRLFPNAIIRNMAFAAMLTLPLVTIASAAAGRISLYWFPVSMYVWSAFPGIFDVRFRRPLRLAISALMLSILFGWLTLANSSFGHIPYANALLIQPWELEIGVVP